MTTPDSHPAVHAATRRDLCIGVALVLVAQALALAFGITPYSPGAASPVLWDSDSYAWLVRLENLMAGQGWFDQRFEQMNAPFGHDMHWGRLYDAVLLAGTMVLALMMPQEAALLTWGLATAPLFQLAALWAVWWGTRDLIGGRGFLILAALFAVQRTLYFQTALGQIDLHAPQLFLYALLIALLLRRHLDDRTHYTILAGVVAAVTVSINVEGQLFLLAALLGLGGLWIVEGQNRFDDLLRLLVGCLIGMALLIPVEYPSGEWVTFAYDRFSALHLGVVAVLFVVAWSARLALVRGLNMTFATRAVLAASAAAAAAMMLWLLFPGYFLGPHPDLNVVMLELMETDPAEVPLLPTGTAMTFWFLIDFGAVIIGGGYALWHLREDKWTCLHAALFILLAFIAVFGVYGTIRFRGLGFGVLAGLIPWAMAVAHLSGARGLAVAVAPWTLAIPLWLVAYDPQELAWDPRRGFKACDYSRIAEPLRAAWTADRPPLVLANMYDGPEIVYRFDWPVVSSPYHRNQDGVTDAFVMGYNPPDAALALLDKRPIDLVVICRYSTRAWHLVSADERLLWHRLTLGDGVPWLTPIPMSDDLDRVFKAYRRTGP